MLVFDDNRDFQDQCLYQRERGSRIGFVPTMGNLHEGHISLVQRAKKETDFCVASLFVNPLQFNNPKDFETYPKTLDEDLLTLKEVGVNAVLVPESSEAFYGDGFSFKVEETELSKGACGARRPGHFLGVTTVVLKLFNLCLPHKAYFGMKDYQQLCIIKKMVSDLSLPIEIIACPTVREPTGLAMSSRNKGLTGAQLELAVQIYRGLQLLQGLATHHPNISWQELLEAGTRFYKGIDPRFQFEYLEAFTAEGFQPVSPENHLSGNHWVVCVAVNIKGVRLIDNIQLAAL